MNRQGLTTKIIPNQANKKSKKKLRPRKKMTVNQVSTILDRRLNSMKTIKYVETLLAGINISTSGLFTTLTAMVQGPSQDQRIADTVWVQRIDISYSVTTANADIFNLSRLMILSWKVSSALALPTTQEIFLNWVNALSHSFLNFERRQNYAVIRDWKINSTGTATNPTTGSQQFVENMISLNGHRIDFDPGALTGTNLIYLFLGSDSTVLPFPILTLNARVWYYDE